MSDMEDITGDLSVPEDIGSEEEAVDVVGDIMDRFLAVADVTAVYGEPVAHGDTLVIPAAEIVAVAGFGVGYGYGPGQGAGKAGCPECEMDEEEGDEEITGESGEEATGEEDWDDEDWLGEDEGTAAGGGGGGGGGKVFARPVAVIVVSGDGRVRVEPVVDATKMVLAAITAGGFMVATLLSLFRPRKH